MMVPFLRQLAGLLLVALFVVPAAGASQADVETDVQTAWRLLDYIAVDYAGAVADGSVINEVEYAEQEEFSATVAGVVGELPAAPGQEGLRAGVARLQAAIAQKADATEVADLARGVAVELLAAYPVTVAPARPPDLVLGAQLYAQQCASCHGDGGAGDGPAAVGLEIPPIDFTDRNRARQRSLFALYQTITQGVDGTSMSSYAQLSSDERWALAFHVGQFAYPDGEAGRQLWESGTALRQQVPDLKTLADTTPAALEKALGGDTADALLAHLRRHPEVLASRSSPLTLAYSRLQESLDAYREGDARQALRLALSAYLDGFEPIEPLLATRSRALLGEVEAAMGAYRNAIQGGADLAVVTAQADVLRALLARVEDILLAAPGSYLSSFIGSAAILLREGLEALLIVVAMMAFLRKAGREEAMRYLHAGWISALLAGLLTWFVATRLIEISGASRELTEGFGSLLAAGVLVLVGIWMHGKSHIDNWQRYVRETMSKALSGRGAWVLLGLVFVVVYREVFETILFYVAMWSQGSHGAIVSGAASAAVALTIIAWLMLRYSARLPITRFFNYSSWLMAIIAVVLAGKGIAALQEAGMIDITPLAGVPRIVSLGIFPSVQSVAGQVLTLAALLGGFAWHARARGRA
ncbi:MAG: FTR1 family protein [Gammaproteobacteria bacterium]|nr:FTR1 family protein [Gammaproteobacteria bacterium]